MQDDFKPRRRKFGVATLLLACFFASGWIRSRSTQDHIEFPATLHASKSLLTFSFDSLFSTDGSLGWVRYHEESTDTNADDVDLGIRYPVWLCSPNPGPIEWNTFQWKWSWHWGGFGIGESKHIDGGRETMLIVPYWSLTSTLIAISAWLLFRKRRPGFPTETSRDLKAPSKS